MSPDPKTAPKAKKRARRRRRAGCRPGLQTTLALLDQHLLQIRRMKLNGEEMKMPTIKVIMMQLLQKELAGSRRARNALLKYKELASVHDERELEVQFADGEAAAETAEETKSGGKNG
jgi:hypothetical protein